MTDTRPERVTINVDGKDVEVDAGELLIQAAQDTGTYIPRFCWHPRMKPVGMCRMCLVEVEGPRGTVLTTSCTIPVTDGMIVHTQSDTVKKAQEGVLEFLLINHPLDCPVCDRGGECPLQDQTMAYGPGESRFVEEKRHFEKPIPISDLVLLDRERCILCARCTRFSDEISGDPLIEFVDRGYGTQVLTFPDEPFTSYFSGNTVQICPVGALTATPYRFRARPWDLEAVESTCTHCSVGCRISVQASQNQVLRFLGVDNDPTNHGWLCDKGRFGFEYINSSERLQTPLVRGDDGELAPASWAEALDRAAELISGVIESKGASAVAGLGGARGTNEDAYAFSKMLRVAIGTPHLDAQLGDGLAARFMAGLVDRATIDDLETAKTILVWGPDLKEELPVLYLRVRRAATQLGATLIVVHPRRSGLDDVADHVLRYRPGSGGQLLRRIAAGEGEAAAVLEALDQGPVVAIVGRTGVAEAGDLAEAVAAFAGTLPDAKILPAVRRSNVFGALDMGVAPDLLPGRVSTDDESGMLELAAAWGPVPVQPGKDAAGIIEGVAAGEVGALLLFGADPIVDHIDRARAEDAFDSGAAVIAVDLFLTASSSRADVVFPALGFAEVEGTVTNLEGRVQKVNRLVAGPGQARAPWAIFEDLARRLGTSIGATSGKELITEIGRVAPAYAGVDWDRLDWGDGREGVVVPDVDATQPLQHQPADTAITPTARDLVLHLGRVLYDHGTLVDRGPSLAKLVPGPSVWLHPNDGHRLGVADGAPVRVRGSAGEAELAAGFDSTLTPGVVYIPFNTGVSVGNGLEVEVEAL